MTGGEMVMAELFEKWLDLAEDELSPTTIREHRRLVTQLIDPAIGETPITELQTARLDEYYPTKSRPRTHVNQAPVSPTTALEPVYRFTQHGGELNEFWWTIAAVALLSGIAMTVTAAVFAMNNRALRIASPR